MPREKSGIFGFEADLLFSDPAVKWVARLLTFACHTILKSLADHQSPIFWNNPDNAVGRSLNAFLVDLGDRLIDQAGDNTLGSVQQHQGEILAEIQARLSLEKKNPCVAGGVGKECEYPSARAG